MLHEHAITYQGSVSIADLDYLAKKANRLGKVGRSVVNVREESDAEGTHVYFDVIGVIDGQRRAAEEV